LFPGIAVAREIQHRYANAEIVFVGAEKGMEARLIPQEGFPLRMLPLGGINRVQGLARFRNLAATMKGIFSAKRILMELKPDAVIGVGGYASFPMMAAAIMKNSMPGLANRMLGRWMDFVAVTDVKTKSFFGDRAVVTGNPVRPQFKSISEKDHRAPYTVLVFGGSQGAQSINNAVRDSLPFLADLKNRLRFVHQTGEKQAKQIREAYAAAGVEAEVRVFFNDFHRQYAEADLIVARAGATTVAEVKAAGRAAILIPLPTAADDHQTKNAQAMVAEDAAIMIANSDLTGEGLAATMGSLFSDISRLSQIERNARRIAVPDAERRIVDLMERAIQKHV